MKERIQQKQWIFSLLPGLFLKTVHEILSSGKNIFNLLVIMKKQQQKLGKLGNWEKK